MCLSDLHNCLNSKLESFVVKTKLLICLLQILQTLFRRSITCSIFITTTNRKSHFRIIFWKDDLTKGRKMEHIGGRTSVNDLTRYRPHFCIACQKFKPWNNISLFLKNTEEHPHLLFLCDKNVKIYSPISRSIFTTYSNIFNIFTVCYKTLSDL